MNVRTYIRETYQEFRRKTASMSKKEVLVDYIWEYYKSHILLFLVLGFVVGSLLHAAVFNRPKPVYVTFSLYGEFLPSSLMGMTEEWIIDAFDVDTTEHSVVVYHFDIGGEDLQMAMMNEEKFITLLMVKELDVIMARSEAYQQRLFAFHPLDMLMSPEELQEFEPYLLYGETEENPNTMPYGIKVDAFDSDFLREHPHFAQGRFLGVAINTDRFEESKALFRLILGL